MVGLPGEKIKIEGGQITVFNDENPNGFTLTESYLPDDLETFDSIESLINIDVDEYFVLGDNRGSSKDSRSFGPVNKSFITGKVLFRGWPLSRITFFGKNYWPSYEQ